MDAKQIISRLFPILLEAKLIIGRQLKMMDKLKHKPIKKERTVPNLTRDTYETWHVTLTKHEPFVIFFLIKRDTYETKPDSRLYKLLHEAAGSRHPLITCIQIRMENVISQPHVPGDEVVIRKSASYHPTVWGDYFILQAQSSPSTQACIYTYISHMF